MLVKTSTYLFNYERESKKLVTKLTQVFVMKAAFLHWGSDDQKFLEHFKARRDVVVRKLNII